MQQPNFYNPQQQNWNAGPPMPGQPMQNGNNPQGGQNVSLQDCFKYVALFFNLNIFHRF